MTNKYFHYTDTCIQTTIFVSMKKISKVKTHVSEFKKINLSAVVFLYSVLRSVFE